ncbi:camelysin. Metallo peptidase. MEROPS family M73 [Lentibacillus halodurans]|uniref:Camelysin. Metallo peptidase. MEROPS family M73 n=1 Tax=Lentibacillus halodurans TaxID=237679 RepID=A0A1I1AF43_9BACI|nr:TasA family protein [Lentibacillus halodurans]SFB36092.1 camelysin. Metallo peptidase. MEROPS family M73 [Lentibacillus halodurans]
MSIRKKLGTGFAAAALGISLVSGGTFAYFSDTEESENTFAAGTLDLSVDPEVIINVDNLRPGDWEFRTFYLENNGSLDITEVLLNTSYEVVDAEGDNTDDFGKHIRVNFLENYDKSEGDRFNDIIYSTTLYELQDMAPDAVAKNVLGFENEQSGLEAGTSDTMYVQFEFVDNEENQNQFQGDALTLNWSFEAR